MDNTEAIKKLNDKAEDMIDYVMYLLSKQENLIIEYSIKDKETGEIISKKSTKDYKG